MKSNTFQNAVVGLVAAYGEQIAELTAQVAMLEGALRARPAPAPEAHLLTPEERVVIDKARAMAHEPNSTACLYALRNALGELDAKLRTPGRQPEKESA